MQCGSLREWRIKTTTFYTLIWMWNFFFPWGLIWETSVQSTTHAFGSSDCFSYLLLCNKVPQIQLKTTHLLSHGFCGSGVWAHFIFCKAAVKMLFGASSDCLLRKGSFQSGHWQNPFPVVAGFVSPCGCRLCVPTGCRLGVIRGPSLPLGPPLIKISKSAKFDKILSLDKIHVAILCT